MGRINSGVESDFDDNARTEPTDNDADDFEGVENVRGKLIFDSLDQIETMLIY